jgi:carbon monoxide dehydrogenase subunit G
MKIALLSILALSVAGCSSLHGLTHQVVGSGVIKTEKRSVSSFTSIDASGAFEIEVICQKEPGLEIEGDDNLLPLVRTEVNGSRLTIKSDEPFSVKKPIRVRISVSTIESISSSGATSFSVLDVKNEKLKIDASGASSIELTGETSALTLDLSGATRVNAVKLVAARVKISMSGAGKATVFASDELDAEVSGAGIVVYSGNPKVIKKVTGVGSVSKKDTSA